MHYQVRREAWKQLSSAYQRGLQEEQEEKSMKICHSGATLHQQSSEVSTSAHTTRNTLFIRPICACFWGPASCQATSQTSELDCVTVFRQKKRSADMHIHCAFTGHYTQQLHWMPLVECSFCCIYGCRTR